jgi:ADP-ribosyl-[dinitrogen reductase] hydrolase
MQDGNRIVVHCRGGLGRTGVIAARLLIELGEAPDKALQRVRAARPGAVETPEQEDYVLRGVSNLISRAPVHARSGHGLER